MGVRLPAEYQEVEYLESNGSQYIITDYYPTSQSEITVKYLITSAPLGQKQIAGVINNRSGVNKIWAINFIRNNGTLITFAGNQITFNTNVQSVNTVYTAKISADGFYLNGTKMGDFGAVSEKVSDHPLYLLRENTVTSSSLSPMIGRIYEASTENPVFIPCYRKFDSKPGMYDPVEGKFYTNAGTGEFTVGPDVIDSISPWLVARRRMLMRKRKYGPNLLALSDFTRASEGATWVVDDQTGIITVTGNRIYAGASTQTTFVQSHLIAGHTYEMHCKLISATNLNGARFAIRGVRGGEHQTAYTVILTAVGEESSVVFTADAYMKYFTLFSTWTDGGSQTIAYSDVWVKEILS